VHHTHLCAAASSTAAGAAASPQPHIVLLIVDDFGWANVGFHAKGQPNEAEIVTPNMDALAAGGIILDRHYAFRFCSPSRSSFLSGRNPIHVNVGNDQLTLVNPADPVSGFAGIPRNMTSIAQKLKNAGYATAQVCVLNVTRACG
jgi:arylsulfatase I/J